MLFPKKELDLSTPKVMGVLNLTPDSFFDGGKFLKKDNTFDESKVFNSIESMIEDGADFIDIGAHSTKPGFTKISPQEELDRIGFVFGKLKDYPILFSIDSFNFAVIKEAILNKIDLVKNLLWLLAHLDQVPKPLFFFQLHSKSTQYFHLKKTFLQQER